MKPIAAVRCPVHGQVDIDELEYEKQLNKPNEYWTCPICGEWAIFDDERFEELNGIA